MQALSVKGESHMEKETLILISVFLGAIAAYITARVTSNNQLRIAEETTKKELKMQSNHIHDERLKAEVTLKREKLERSEERRVGNECATMFRSRWSPCP